MGTCLALLKKVPQQSVARCKPTRLAVLGRLYFDRSRPLANALRCALQKQLEELLTAELLGAFNWLQYARWQSAWRLAWRSRNSNLSSTLIPPTPRVCIKIYSVECSHYRCQIRQDSGLDIAHRDIQDSVTFRTVTASYGVPGPSAIDGFTMPQTERQLGLQWSLLLEHCLVLIYEPGPNIPCQNL